MLDKIVFLLSFSRRAGKMMTIIIFSSICKYFILVQICSQCCENNSMTLTNCSLFDKVLIEIFNLLWLPELLRKNIFVTISNSTTTKSIETPLVELTIICNCSGMILIDININKFDCIGIISYSTKNRFSLNIFSTAKSSLTVVTS